MEKWVRASARFCPSVSAGTVRGGAANGGGHPRAMLAPDASVGKAEKNSDLAVCGKISVALTLVLKRYFADSVFFGSCITDFGR